MLAVLGLTFKSHSAGARYGMLMNDLPPNTNGHPGSPQERKDRGRTTAHRFYDDGTTDWAAGAENGL